MKVKKEITIYDIARKLSLSTATISRGLKDHPAINKATRKKIQDTAGKMGYRHNNFASSLRTQKSNTIGVLVHELNSNFITSVLSGIEKVTAEAGYDIIFAHSSESDKKEVANAINLFHKRVDGLIASLSFTTTGLDHFQPYKDKRIPVVFFDRVEEKSPYTKIIIDNYRSGYLATQHLIDQGCSRIVLVTASQQRNVYARRFEGYKAALKDNHIPFSKKRVLIKDLSETAGVEAAMEILAMKPLPDAAFITNDFSAAVCMQTLTEHGIRIPEDFAIIGFNNDAISKIVHPKLSTVNYPGRTIGELAARRLINQIGSKDIVEKIETVIVDAEVVVRESSVRSRSKKK